jgi:hypothetical protein
LSEAVATVTLAGAVFVGALGLLFSLGYLFPAFHLPSDSLIASRLLGGSALLLAVLSAASRAYRSGYTLPAESESYEEYCDRVSEINAVFRSAKTDEQRLRQLEQLESEAASELRRFLRTKMHATFVF